MPRRRKAKLFSFRGHKLKVGKKGLRVTKPTARIGGKAGLNISSKGVSASLRTKSGSVSTRRGISITPFRWLSKLLGMKKTGEGFHKENLDHGEFRDDNR